MYSLAGMGFLYLEECIVPQHKSYCGIISKEVGKRFEVASSPAHSIYTLTMSINNSRQVFIHAGGNKTGTTTIQNTFRRGQDLLKARDIIYPDFSDMFPTKPSSHWPVAVAFMKQPELYYLFKDYKYTPSLAVEFSSNIRMQLTEISKLKQNLFISSEAIANLEQEELESLNSFLSQLFDKVSVVFYARYPDESSFVSFFQQSVKGGHCPSYHDVIHNRTFRQTEQAIKLKSVFDDDLCLKTFRKEELFKKCIVKDLLCAMNLDDDLREKIPVWSINQSMLHASIALLYFYNSYLLESGSGFARRSGSFSEIYNEILSLNEKLLADDYSKLKFPFSRWSARFRLDTFESWKQFLELSKQEKAIASHLGEKQRLEKIAIDCPSISVNDINSWMMSGITRREMERYLSPKLLSFFREISM